MLSLANISSFSFKILISSPEQANSFFVLAVFVIFPAKSMSIIGQHGLFQYLLCAISSDGCSLLVLVFKI